jgi:hypothetical protein
LSDFFGQVLWDRTDYERKRPAPKVFSPGRNFRVDWRSTMANTNSVANPFALMLDPDAVMQAVERLERVPLKRHICRPLDRPLIPTKGEGQSGEFDREVDMSDDIALEADVEDSN